MTHIELKLKYNVSIHAPREGCDSFFSIVPSGIWGFNSRTPGGVRRAL